MNDKGFDYATKQDLKDLIFIINARQNSEYRWMFKNA